MSRAENNSPATFATAAPPSRARERSAPLPRAPERRRAAIPAYERPAPPPAPLRRLGSAAPTREPNARASSAPRHRSLVMLGRIALGAATMILSINVWSGFPLLSLWVGSRFAHGDALSMMGIVVALITLVILMTVSLAALSWLSNTYDRLTGRRRKRQQAPWLRSMRGGPSEVALTRREANAVEAIVVITVVAAVIAFEVWFFVLAGSPLPHG